MLRTVLRLAESEKDLRIGNHNVVIKGDIHRFKYFGSVICMANYKTKKFLVSYCGYENSSSTKRAVQDYRNYFFLGLGYQQVYNADEVRENDTTRYTDKGGEDKQQE